MNGKVESTALQDRQADPADFARAILNILEDSAAEHARLADTQSAVLNVLEDSAGEKVQTEATQKAILNILEDSAGEQARLADTQSAALNVLEDAAGEKVEIQATQKAILNILEDSAGEQARMIETQRAVLNVLEDFDAKNAYIEHIDAKNAQIEQINKEMAVEITARKRSVEALNATNRELEAFSYSVSHDLRAPLRSIDGFSQALLEDCSDKLDADGKNYLQRIRAAAQRMAMLIDELLKLARISRGEMRNEPVDLSAIATAILAELRELDANHRPECIVPEGIMAYGDSGLLHAVLENLLGNAWKYTSKKDHARIEFGSSRQKGKSVYFVRDNGAGFDMTYAEKLFGVFQRLHSDAEFPGVGVGLAIVQRVVQRHGGRAWAEGAKEKGATFSFTLHEGQEV